MGNSVKRRVFSEKKNRDTRDELFDDANGDLAIGELESAVEKYRASVELDPTFFDGWHALGMALMKVGRFPEAIEAGKKATELRPNDQIGWTSLSLFYNRNGNIKEAEAAGTKDENTESGRENRAGARLKSQTPRSFKLQAPPPM